MLSRFLPFAWLDALAAWVGGWPVWAAVPGLERLMVENIVRGQVMLVLIPAIILILAGYRERTFRLGRGHIKPALPFLVVCSAILLSSGLSQPRVVFLLYAFLYPGFTEEFFYRGAMQPLLLRVGASPPVAIGLAAVAFAGGHIPDFVLRVYEGMIPLAVGQAPVWPYSVS